MSPACAQQRWQSVNTQPAPRTMPSRTGAAVNRLGALANAGIDGARIVECTLPDLLDGASAALGFLRGQYLDLALIGLGAAEHEGAGRLAVISEGLRVAMCVADTGAEPIGAKRPPDPRTGIKLVRPNRTQIDRLGQGAGHTIIVRGAARNRSLLLSGSCRLGGQRAVAPKPGTTGTTTRKNFGL